MRGKLENSISEPTEPKAHPRVCGENSEQSAIMIRSRGSSPRVRGKLSPAIRDLAPVGLIPACAGKTRRLSSCDNSASAHPRVCGENTYSNVEQEWIAGSSPRVRGKPVEGNAQTYSNGLIPACAGKTTAKDIRDFASGAHPRVCGENEAAKDDRPQKLGSSPRVRGKPQMVQAIKSGSRLIPACAGKTDHSSR